MSATGRHLTRGTIDIAAPADQIYGVIVDAARWPQFFAPTVHVERTDLGASRERLQIWATGNGEVRTWTSLRELDPDQRTVEFRQEISAPPVKFMSGRWSITPLTSGGARLTLAH